MTLTFKLRCWFLPGCPGEEPAAKSCCCQLGLFGEEGEPCSHFGAFSFLLCLQKTWGHFDLLIQAVNAAPVCSTAPGVSGLISQTPLAERGARVHGLCLHNGSSEEQENRTPKNCCTVCTDPLRDQKSVSK